MKFRLPSFLAVLSIALAVLFAAPWHSSGQAQDRFPQQVRSIKLPARQFMAGFDNSGSGRKAQAEKRHGKSLLSEAILTDPSIPAPRFSYRSRNYSLFLPGGCSRRPFYSCSLRGPPFCC
jgi:hypothetical protein